MTVKSKHGGQRQAQEARFDLIPYEGLDAVGRVMALGEAKYGRHPERPESPNWTGLDLATDQSPLNHAVKHLYAHAAGDESEDNLAAAAANLLMLLWFRDNPSSPYYGLRYPEILGGGEHREELPATDFLANLVRGFASTPDDDQKC